MVVSASTSSAEAGDCAPPESVPSTDRAAWLGAEVVALSVVWVGLGADCWVALDTADSVVGGFDADGGSTTTEGSGTVAGAAGFDAWGVAVAAVVSRAEVDATGDVVVTVPAAEPLDAARAPTGAATGLGGPTEVGPSAADG